MPTSTSTVLGVLVTILVLPGPARAEQPAGHGRAVGGGPQPVPGLQIKADHLDLAAHQKELHLKGNVQVQTHGPQGEVRIRASQVVVRLDARGTPVAVDARGPVTVQLGQSKAVARRLRMRIPRNAQIPRVVELVGEVRLDLESPRLTVSGERIWLELESGRMSVDRARLDLAPPRPASSADRRAGEQGHGG